MPRRPRIKFFIDQCVPDAVGRALAQAGHHVTLLREVIPADSPDPLVAEISQVNGAVLVSHDTDFRTLAPRVGTGRARFQRLSRIGLKCREPRAADRIMEALSLIEFEWKLAQKQSDKRIIIEIGETVIRTVR